MYRAFVTIALLCFCALEWSPPKVVAVRLQLRDPPSRALDVASLAEGPSAEETLTTAKETLTTAKEPPAVAEEPPAVAEEPAAVAEEPAAATADESETPPMSQPAGPQPGSLPAGLGSLPPIAVGSQGPDSVVPMDLLPSNVNVVTHQANYGEQNPKRRPSCTRIVEEVERSTVKNRNSPAFGAFETIIGILSRNLTEASGIEDDETDYDKIINYAINVIQSSSAGPRALDWNYIASLRNCAVDAFGRTIFMKLVENGNLKALANAGSRRLNGIDITKLRDTMNNNIVHLAVMSKNIHVCEIALDLVGVDHTVTILRQPNIDGRVPLQLAELYALEDVSDMLKARYSTAVLNSFMSSRRKHQAPDLVLSKL